MIKTNYSKIHTPVVLYFLYFSDEVNPEERSLSDNGDSDEAQNDLENDTNELSNFQDEVVSVYEQIRTLVVNLKRSGRVRGTSHGRQSISGTSLHTSMASSESSDHLATQFRVMITSYHY